MKVMKEGTWNNYRRAYYGNFQTNKAAEDICNCCTHIKVLLSLPSTTAEEKAMLELALNLHVKAAKDMRRAMNEGIKAFCTRFLFDDAPAAAAVADWLPKDLDLDLNRVLDEEELERCLQRCEHVLVECQDFGGSGTIPTYFMDH